MIGLDLKSARLATLGVLLCPAAVHAQSPSNQLCGAAGQGSGCIGTFSSHAMGMPTVMPNNSSYNPYYNPNFLFMLPSMWMDAYPQKPRQNSDQARISREAEIRRKKKLKLIALLYDDFRDPPFSEVKLRGGQLETLRAKRGILSDLIDAALSQFGLVPSNQPNNRWINEIGEIQRCIDSRVCNEIVNAKAQNLAAHQQSGPTCEPATEADIIKADNRPFELKLGDSQIATLDPAKLNAKELEALITTYSIKKGYFTSQNGVFLKDIGHFLGDIGYKVNVRNDTIGPEPQVEDIAKALQQGRHVEVGVSAQSFYRDFTINSRDGHALIVTGVIENHGVIKAVRVNDTQMNRTGVLVPIQHFKKSWEMAHESMAEITPPRH